MFHATGLFTITLLFTTDARREAAADRTPPDISHVRETCILIKGEKKNNCNILAADCVF
jgi:hypothetical protein